MKAGDLQQLEELGRVVSCVEVSGCDVAQLDSTLQRVRTVQRLIDGLVARIATRADELAVDGRSAPAEDTLRGSGSVGSRQAKREAKRARAAEAMPGLGEALSGGATTADHADVLANLTDEQRSNLDIEGLLAKASQVPVETFRRLVKRAIDSAATDHGLSDSEAKRRASEFRHWFDHSTGMGRFSGALDPERYEAMIGAVEQHTDALAAASEELLSKDRRLAATALVDLVTASGELNARGQVPSITVIVDHDTVVHGAHDQSVRQTANGHDLAPESLARLCCDSTIRKVLLDERGVPLHVGRSARTATAAQWAALKTLHHSCAWNGCTAPISWCQAHHILEWEHGGPTDLDNLVPLCSRHHHRVHEGQWSIKLLPDRTLKIYRPDGAHQATITPPRRSGSPVAEHPHRSVAKASGAGRFVGGPSGAKP